MFIKRVTKAKNYVEGFTLVEVILALAIIGILSVAMIPVFSGSVTSIFIMGNRTQALSDARTILDEITSKKNISDAFIESIQPDTTIEKILDCSDITNSYSGYRVRYCTHIQEFTVNAKVYSQTIVTIVVFYNMNAYVTLTSSFSEG